MSAQLQGNVEYFARSVVSRKPTMGFTRKDRVDSDPNKRIVSIRQQHLSFWHMQQYANDCTATQIGRSSCPAPQERMSVKKQLLVS